MPSSKKDKKVEVSFTNWVLGGSLVSVSSTESQRHRKRVISRKATVGEVDSDGNEIVKEKPKKEDEGRKQEGKAKEQKDGAKEKDTVKCDDKKCEKCGKGKKEKSNDKKDESKQDDSKADESEKDEKKSDDADVSKKAEMSGGDRGSECNWTAEQDKKIKELKTANKSWKDIAAEVGASKKDVTNRFKELNKDGNQDNGNTSSEKKDESQNSGSGNGEDSAVDNSGLDFSNLFDDFGSGVEASKQNSANDQSNDPTSFWDRPADPVDSKSAPRNDSQSFWNQPINTGVNESNSLPKKNGEKKQQQNQQDKKTGGKSTNQGGNGEDSSNHGEHNLNGLDNGNSNGAENRNWDNSSNDNNNEVNDQNWNQPSNNHNNGAEKQTPNQPKNATPKQTWNQSFEAEQRSKGQLQSNEVWSKDDCEVLEYLHKQYEEHKWLHIQAGFFNWTGRMIIAEIIEQKFIDDGVI